MTIKRPSMGEMSKTIAAFAALAEGTPDDLPCPSWNIYCWVERIGGQVNDRAELAAWASHFGVPVTEETSPRGIVRGYVRDSWDGVPVEIWAELHPTPPDIRAASE
jgi:hypothetical protein